MAFLLACLWFLSRGPDFNLAFSRTVPTELGSAELSLALGDIRQWPKWFFWAKDTTVVDATGAVLEGQYSARDGELIRMGIEPKGMKSRRFELLLKIQHYVPARELRIEVVSDSKGRITKLFDSVEWSIVTGEPGKPGVIAGAETAHTSHWRSRLFGRVASRVFMNQIFYPDLMTLGHYGMERAPDLFPN